MTTISHCRDAPPLPDTIEKELIIVQMLTLEKHLRETNQLFEPDLYLSILDRLADVYRQVNSFKDVGARFTKQSEMNPIFKCYYGSSQILKKKFEI
jgi:hypothetical protein